MSLILAIEPDRRQAAKVYALADTLGVELIHGETTETALAALGTRQPDLVLTSQLLSPKDETALADRLRELDAAGAHVATLVIPVLRGEEGEKKKKAGLFGRLRRSKDEKTTEGCEPAVFGAEITEYLERAAVERAALAQAQADLEAAWADSPAPVMAAAAVPAPAAASTDAALDALFSQPSAYDTSDATVASAVEVHPGMVIEDPEALFGEFAAIPIRRAAEAMTSAPDMATSAAPAVDSDAVAAYENGDVAANFEALFGTAPADDDRRPGALGDGEDSAAVVGNSDGDDSHEPLSTMPAASAGPAAHEDDWEEIALDTGDDSARAFEAPEHRAPEHHVELASGSVDLDEFVRELETVKSSANAQPMIPVVDLSHVLAGDVELPEPEIVTEQQIKEEDRATFDAEIAAVFATEPEMTFEAEPELAEEPVVHVAPPDVEAAEPVADVLEPTAKPATLWPEFPDLKSPAWQPPTETPAAPERWRTAIETLQAPTVAAPSADVSVVKEPAMKAGWHDMLSAMRRDIDQGRKEEETPAVIKPRVELNPEPLIFPKRPTVTASLISNIEAPKAFKRPIDAAPAPDLQAPAAALQKLLETVVVPKVELAGSEAAIADSVGSEAAALEAALSGINVADVAGGEKIELQPDLSSNPVWAGGASLAASLEEAVEEPLRTEDAMSPESAAPELQTVDLSWLHAPAAAPAPMELEAHAEAPTSAPVADVIDGITGVDGAEALSLEELERLTRPTPEPVIAEVTPVTTPMMAPVAAPMIAPPEPEPVATVAPVVTSPVTPVDTEWKAQRGTKSKKKRKQGQAAAQPVKSSPAPAVRAVDEDFGFFDPHQQGFLPLLARLNQIGGSGLPLR